MKKTIAILLVLVIGMAGAFATEKPAATSHDLKLTATVSHILETKLVKTQVSGDTLDLAVFDGLTNVENLSHDVSDSNEGFAYLYVKTNYSGGYTLTISGENLSTGTANDSEIRYVLTATGEGSGNVATLDLVDSDNNSTASVTGVTELIVKEYEIRVSVNSTDLANAKAADYSADVKFTFTAN